jgi:hypothetical protein
VHRTIEWINNRPEIPAAIEHMTPTTFRGDGLLTQHVHSFLDDPEFSRAYDRAVKASGWDYGIPWRTHVLLWAARTASRVPGAYVECGTGRGFMASAICEYEHWVNRPFYLFDTFEPGLVTPDSAERQAEHSQNYANGPDTVRDNFSEWPGVQIVVGMVPASLDTVPIESVAFLHIDMNNPVPEEAALRYFWPRLSNGAMVVFDDYAHRGFESQHNALNEVAAAFGFSIVSLPTGQGVAVKS